MHDTPHDHGYTIIELLLVIVVLGILTTIVVLSVGGVTTEAQETGCAADRRMLETAGEAYFAQRRTSTIPDAGGGPDGYEQTLVDEELLRQTSEYFDLDADGALVAAAGSPCTV
jgi:prepilin-type N-terminal cleavage/methylation domain-containing protein